MIDRQAIARQVRDWAQEASGLGFTRTEGAFLEEGGDEDVLRVLTARGTPTRTRRKPNAKVKRLSATALRVEENLWRVEQIDNRYRRALVIMSLTHNVMDGATFMRRSVGDFCRFAEAGFALFAAFDRR